MIQSQTRLSVADNSGAKTVMCIRVLKTGCQYASVGDVIICAVKTARPNLAVARSEVVRAVIVRVKKAFGRKDGSRLRFDDNAVVLIDKENNPRGTRVFGPVARELKDKGFTKITSLAPEVI